MMSAANSCPWHQNHASGIKFMLLASNACPWYDIHASAIKIRLLASKACFWHQMHAPDIKIMPPLASKSCSWHQHHAPGIKIFVLASWSAITCTFQIELIQPIYQFNNGLVLRSAGFTLEVYLVLIRAARNLQASKKKKKGINEFRKSRGGGASGTE